MTQTEQTDVVPVLNGYHLWQIGAVLRDGTRLPLGQLEKVTPNYGDSTRGAVLREAAGMLERSGSLYLWQDVSVGVDEFLRLDVTLVASNDLAQAVPLEALVTAVVDDPEVTTAGAVSVGDVDSEL